MRKYVNIVADPGDLPPVVVPLVKIELLSLTRAEWPRKLEGDTNTDFVLRKLPMPENTMESM